MIQLRDSSSSTQVGDRRGKTCVRALRLVSTTIALGLTIASTACAADAGADEAEPVRAPRGILSMPAAELNERPEPLRDIGFDQRLGEKLPLDLEFQDERGDKVRLGELFGERPVVLLLAYYGCPMLCPLAVEGLARALKPVAFDAGKEFDVVVVSFDPADTPAKAMERKAEALRTYGRDGGDRGWHFLVGRKESIDQLTKAVGYHYAWDESSKQFAHPAGVVVATPEGALSRYLFGLDPAPRDLRLALLESSRSEIGTPVDQVLLFCFQYDPKHGRYSAAAINAVRLGGVLTVATLGLLIGGALWRERRRRGEGSGS